MGANLDALLDLAHDWGQVVQWGHSTITSQGRQVTSHWVGINLPDGPVEHRAPTRDAAAWSVLRECIGPDPEDTA